MNAKIESPALAVEPLSVAEIAQIATEARRVGTCTAEGIGLCVAERQRAKVRPAPLPTVDSLAKVLLPIITSAPSGETCAVECARAVLAHLGAQPAASEGYDWAERAALLGAQVARLTRENSELAERAAEAQLRFRTEESRHAETRERLTRERDEVAHMVVHHEKRKQLEFGLRELGIGRRGSPEDDALTTIREQRAKLDEQARTLSEQAAEIARLKDAPRFVKDAPRFVGSAELAAARSESVPQAPPAEACSNCDGRGEVAIDRVGDGPEGRQAQCPKCKPAEAPMPRLESETRNWAMDEDPCGEAGKTVADMILRAASADMADAVKAAVETCAKGFAVLRERDTLEIKQMREVIVWREADREADARRIAKLEQELEAALTAADRNGEARDAARRQAEENAQECERLRGALSEAKYDRDNAAKLAEESSKRIVELEESYSAAKESINGLREARDNWHRQAEENAQAARELAELRKLAPRFILGLRAEGERSDYERIQSLLDQPEVKPGDAEQKNEGGK